jgi:hypothetical protein
MEEPNQKRLKFNDNQIEHPPPVFPDEEAQPLFEEGSFDVPKHKPKLTEKQKEEVKEANSNPAPFPPNFEYLSNIIRKQNEELDILQKENNELKAKLQQQQQPSHHLQPISNEQIALLFQENLQLQNEITNSNNLLQLQIQFSIESQQQYQQQIQ